MSNRRGGFVFSLLYVITFIYFDDFTHFLCFLEQQRHQHDIDSSSQLIFQYLR